jgi:hypothetical protein
MVEIKSKEKEKEKEKEELGLGLIDADRKRKRERKRNLFVERPDGGQPMGRKSKNLRSDQCILLQSLTHCFCFMGFPFHSQTIRSVKKLN